MVGASTHARYLELAVIEGEVEAAHRAGEDVGLDVRLADRAQIREALREFLKQNCEFEARQVRADAEVGAIAER